MVWRVRVRVGDHGLDWKEDIITLNGDRRIYVVMVKLVAVEIWFGLVEG